MIYAVQIAPEYQESPLFIEDSFFPDDIAIFGNRQYVERWPDAWKRVADVLDAGELAEALDDIENRRGGYYCDVYRNATEAINDLLYPEREKPYNTREIHRLKEIFTEYGFDRREENNLICAALEIVTGRPFAWATIRGACQGDWQEIIYPTDAWSREALDAFEIEYFNLGTEWIVDDSREACSDPEEITGYSVYCHGYDAAEIIREIAETAGVKPEEVTCYTFNGWTRAAKYELLEA